MDKKQIKSIRLATKLIATDVTRLKKAVKVLDALTGFTAEGNAEMLAAAHAEIFASVQALQVNAGRIAEALGESVAESINNDGLPF